MSFAGFVRIIYTLSFTVTSVLFYSPTQHTLGMSIHLKEIISYRETTHLSYIGKCIERTFLETWCFCRARCGTCTDTQNGMPHSIANDHVIKLPFLMLSRLGFTFLTCHPCTESLSLVWVAPML